MADPSLSMIRLEKKKPLPQNIGLQHPDSLQNSLADSFVVDPSPFCSGNWSLEISSPMEMCGVLKAVITTSSKAAYLARNQPILKDCCSTPGSSIMMKATTQGQFLLEHTSKLQEFDQVYLPSLSCRCVYIRNS